MANVYVSNGTCYTGPGAETDLMIPCGNAYFGHVGCCQALDTCLSNSVCYNGQFGVTYLTGCTDPEYEAEVCPGKFDDSDAPWLGMSYCNGTSNEWVLCDQQGHPDTLEKGDPCWCPTDPNDRSMTLSASTAIFVTASLPSATGESIGWLPGFYPAAPTSDSSTSKTATTPTTATATASPSSTPGTVNSGVATPYIHEAFSTSGKIGVAFGASVFAILLLAGIAFFIMRHRSGKQSALDKKKPSHNPDDSSKPTTPGGPAPPPHLRASTIGVAFDGTTAGRNSAVHDVSQQSMRTPSPRASVAELDNKAARPWSALSELDDSSYLGSTRGTSRMESIAEASHGRGVGFGGGHGLRQGGQGEAQAPSELEAPRGLVELPA